MASKFNRTLSSECFEKQVNGDVSALNEVYRVFSQPIFTLALRILGSKTLASDVTQDVLITIFEKLDDCRNPNAVGAWIRKIVINECYNFLRRRPELQIDEIVEVGCVELDPEFMKSRSESQIEMENALRHLSLQARTVLWLHEVEGMKHHEIAELCGYSVSFSKTTLSRAIKKVKESIKREWGEVNKLCT